MKIRTSLVANSSSSSYIVKIPNLSYSQFVAILMENYSWSHFNPELIEKTYEELITESSNEIKNASIAVGQLYKKRIEHYRKFIEKIKNFNDVEELIRTVFDESRIGLEEEQSGISLRYETLMHNDFDTGMSSLLKEIVLCLCFDYKFKIDFERISDD